VGEIPREDQIVEVTVYGLNRKERVVRLIDRLARIPCVPMTIHRIDKFGRVLGVVDAIREDLNIFVRVLRWDPEVDIEWTLVPGVFHPQLRSRSTRALKAFTSTLRQPTWKHKISLQRQLKIYHEGCKNA
tara:strand:- start:885 stop:1274 length:390 start_codon:yes stop_codon:yes gene_type:complete